MQILIGTLRRYVRLSEWLSERVGHAVSWLTTLLVVAVCCGVLMRYVLTSPRFIGLGSWFARIGDLASSQQVAVQELQLYFFGFLFLLAAAYCLRHDRHVRVDIIYSRLSARQRAWIDLVGIMVFLVPFAVLVIAYSWGWAGHALASGERSPNPGGLPAVGLLKAAVPVSFILLLLQGLARGARSVLLLMGHPEPAPVDPLQTDEQL